MRNAATLDDDFGYNEPRRRTSTRKTRQAPGNARKRKGGGFRLDTRKVARYLAVGLCTSLVCGIAVNALVLQKNRHPAPLFGKAAAIAPATVPVAAKVAAVPFTAEPQPIVAPLPPAQATAAPKAHRVGTATPDRSGPVTAVSAKNADDDAIAKLLAGSGSTAQRGGGASAEKAAEKPGDASQTKTVTSVQRALAKLGYNVKATGTLGAQTHKAIEAFEKDRHMPVTGETSRRLTKVLGAESGLKID